MKKRMLALIAVIALIVVTAGCGNKEDGKHTKVDTSSNQTEESNQNDQNRTSKLSMFVALDPKTAASRKSLSEVPAIQEIEKRTGITIDFLHPAGNNTAEQLSLTLAANELPDMFSLLWSSIPGGVEKLYSSGQIIDITPYYETCMPNLQKLVEKYPEIKTEMITDDGKILMLPELRMDLSTQYFECFMIRKDWLKAVGKEMPKNKEELHEVLQAFKTQDPNGNGKQDEIPFVSGSDQPGVERLGYLFGLNTAWTASNCMYVVDGKVKFGPAQPAYKEYLETMHQWYQEGLIDVDYLSTDAAGRDARITSDIGGMFYGKMNGQMAVYMAAMSKVNPEFDLVAMPYAAAADGKCYDFNSTFCVGASGIAISSQCKDVETALKFVDYLYAEEGNRISNFGIEGETYKLENGKPVYTDLITKNTDGLSVVQAIAKYTIGGIPPRMINDIDYWDAVMTFPQQKTVYEECSKATRDNMLPLVSLTVEESKDINAIFNDLRPYIQEMTNKFIMGDIPLSEFDTYLTKVNEMKIESVVTNYQNAYERFGKR